MHQPPDIFSLAYKQPVMQEQLQLIAGEGAADPRIRSICNTAVSEKSAMESG